jgi:hypothetical protein
MTRPDPSRIDSYCAALKAFHAGERVEYGYDSDDLWLPIPAGAVFPSFSNDLRARIAEPAPPKARVIEVPNYDEVCKSYGDLHFSAYREGVYKAGCTLTRFREVLATETTIPTAELQALRDAAENERKLRAAITEYFDGTGPHAPTLLYCMDKHEAHL